MVASDRVCYVCCMAHDVRCQSQLAATSCVSASKDAIDDVETVSSAYCYVISRHSYRMM